MCASFKIAHVAGVIGGGGRVARKSERKKGDWGEGTPPVKTPCN